MEEMLTLCGIMLTSPQITTTTLKGLITSCQIRDSIVLGIGLSMEGLLSMVDVHTIIGTVPIAQNQMSSICSSILTSQS